VVVKRKRWLGFEELHIHGMQGQSVAPHQKLSGPRSLISGFGEGGTCAAGIRGSKNDPTIPKIDISEPESSIFGMDEHRNFEYHSFDLLFGMESCKEDQIPIFLPRF